ncbi:MAG: dipeptidase [Anaerocolumna sp.]
MKVADMHCDTIAEIFYGLRDGRDIGLAKNNLHQDLEKMAKGDYLVQNFAMFVSIKEYADPLEHCLKLIDLFYNEVGKNLDKIAVALNYADIMNNQKSGKMSALLTIEEGGVTKCNLAHLRNFYRLGVRMLTLTWNYENGIGYPNFKLIEGEKPDFHSPDTKQGLTEFGLEFIREMERLGMIIDVSHLSDAGFYQLLNNTTRPFVASHSNARGICNHVRNLSDDMIRKLSERGGVMGMNYCSSFLEDAENEKDAVGTIPGIVDHIKYITTIGGYECIGLGSDYDGIPVHRDLPDASYLPLLAEALEKEGFKQHEIEAIFYKNVLRLYKDVLK